MTPSWPKIHRVVPIALLVLAGCATAPPPTRELSEAEQAVRAARDAGASTFAPVELRFAEDKLGRARSASEAEDYDEAGALARQALVDSELATAKARAGKTRAEVQARSEDNARLRRELLGDGGGG
jgi:hypothetical protein